jgi:hypothetical protein
MEAEELVVDQPLDEIEGAPSGEQQPGVCPPGRRKLAALPCSQHQARRDGDEDPGRQVEEAVDEGVGLEPRHRVHRLAPGIPGEHVVPLEDLMEHDAVDEPAEAESQDERRPCHDPSHEGGLPAVRVGRKPPTFIPLRSSVRHRPR